DGNACTAGDHCDGDPGHEACVASPVACDGPCLTCDPAVGCVPKSARAACDDGDACTGGDHCVGTSNVCVPGRPATCKGQCLTGACDHRLGCVPKPAGSVCDDGNPCTLGDRCSGTGDVCSAADTLPCRGQCLTGACGPARGGGAAAAASPGPGLRRGAERRLLRRRWPHRSASQEPVTRGRLLGLMVAVAALSLAAVPFAGRLLVVADPLPASADAIVVLAGSIPSRVLEASDLYRAGVAPRVVVTRERLARGESALHARGVH